ncbi:MAG: permease [Lachnospiraceae bacterium]|nr:permease [Lachnospiraceae bacterium]
MLGNEIFLLFLIMTLGYALGRIRVNGISLGAAGILLTALISGHFGYEVEPIVQNMGLVSFVAAVGFIAGPSFVHQFRGNARAYTVTGLSIIASAVLVCVVIIYVTGIPTELVLGLLAGSLTTTPGLAAAIEATGSDLVSVGYGIAYPFGVISVVMFVQVMPRLLHVDMEAEKRYILAVSGESEKTVPENLIRVDSHGMFSFSVAIILGLLIGKISVPMPGGGSFSLGSSGGPLLAGIALGYIRNIGIFDMRVSGETLTTMRELGLAFFLAGAGTRAGKGFMETLAQEGLSLFLYGAVMAIVPIAVGYFVAVKVFRLRILSALGSICGGMTSTPALGTLISSTGTDDVTGAYAATYPVALAMIVVMMALLGGMVK